MPFGDTCAVGQPLALSRTSCALPGEILASFRQLLLLAEGYPLHITGLREKSCHHCSGEYGQHIPTTSCTARFRGLGILEVSKTEC